MQDELARQGAALSILQHEVGAMKIEIAVQGERAKAIPEIDKRVEGLETIMSEFRGASKAVRIAWTLAGAVGMGAILKFLELVNQK